MTQSLEQVAAAQFGPRAAAYVNSAVHAAGEDLDWLAAHLRGLGAGSLLDVGCGGGHVAYCAAAHVAAVTACDPSAEMLAAVAEMAASLGLAGISTRRAAAEDLPFGDGCFDAVATRFSAHHWADWAQGLREMARVVRPGGAVFVMDAASPGVGLLDTHVQTIETLRDASHVRNYALGEWVAALAQAGISVREARTARLRMDFADWVARMGTPAVAVAAIRHVQGAAPAEVVRHFGIEGDGSFWLDTVWVMGVKA